MTISLYFQCLAMFILGQIAQITLIKIPVFKRRAGIVDGKFILKDWWKCDWNIVVGTTALGAILFTCIDEILKWEPAIYDRVKLLFGFVGAFGSNYFLSKYSKYMKYFDVVTKDKVQQGETRQKEQELLPPSDPEQDM